MAALHESENEVPEILDSDAVCRKDRFARLIEILDSQVWIVSLKEAT